MSGIAPADLERVATGIFYTRRPFVVAGEEIVDFLEREARSNGIGRARVCAHPSAEADQHDMLIVSHRDTYVAPHRHLSNSESFTVIEGRTDVLLFDAQGALTDRFAMGPAPSGLPFFYRMPARQYHGLDIESEFLVFVESTKGPFRRDNMECASWAPPADQLEAGRAFVRALRRAPSISPDPTAGAS